MIDWFYLSFAGEEGFRGGCIVAGKGEISALQRSHKLRINPGGQVLFIKVPNDKLPPHQYRDRLLSREQLEEIWELEVLDS
jgi:hypothetical protein